MFLIFVYNYMDIYLGETCAGKRIPMIHIHALFVTRTATLHTRPYIDPDDGRNGVLWAVSAEHTRFYTYIYECVRTYPSLQSVFPEADMRIGYTNKTVCSTNTRINFNWSRKYRRTHSADCTQFLGSIYRINVDIEITCFPEASDWMCAMCVRLVVKCRFQS